MFENLTQPQPQPQPQPQKPQQPQQQPATQTAPVQNVAPTITVATPLTDVFTLENINLSFDTSNGKFTLFDNFNFRIEDIPNEGQFVSILGASGSGKSQILKLLSGLSKPQSGSEKLPLFYCPRGPGRKTSKNVIEKYKNCHAFCNNDG